MGISQHISHLIKMFYHCIFNTIIYCYTKYNLKCTKYKYFILNNILCHNRLNIIHFLNYIHRDIINNFFNRKFYNNQNILYIYYLMIRSIIKDTFISINLQLKNIYLSIKYSYLCFYKYHNSIDTVSKFFLSKNIF